MDKYKHKIIASWVLLFFLCIGFRGTISYAKEDVVTVGYTEYDQLIHKSGNGKMYGYGVEYLNQLAKYAGFHYEYVLIEESEREEKLQDGTVDLLFNVSKRTDMAGKLHYSQNASSMEYALLYALDTNTDIFFDEYAALDGKRVGINVNDSIQENLLNAYAREHNITFETFYYDDLYDMGMALENDEIDLMYVSSLRDVQYLKIVAKVGMSEFYFATGWENEELMDRLNEAHAAMARNMPMYGSVLYVQYYGKPANILNGITRQEYNFIQATEPIKVAYNANNYPIEYYDEEAQIQKGVDIEVLSLIAEKNGLPFEYIKVNSEKEALELLEQGEVDMVSGFYANDVSRGLYDIGITESYLTIDYIMLSSKDVVNAEIKSVALPADSVSIQYYVMEEHPDWEIIYKENIDECITAVKEGEADITLINAIRLQSGYNSEVLKDVKILMTEAINLDISYAVRKDMSPIFVSVMNKTIYSIPEDHFKACITENAVGTAYVPNATEIMKRSIPYFIAVVVTIVIVFIFVLRQREQHYKKIATEDSVSGLWTGIKFRKEATALLNRNKQTEYYLISLDIDKFKNMNNSLGSKTADKILGIIGYRLHALFKDKAFYARDMADMFLIMIEKCDDLEEMLSSLSKEIYLNQNGKKQYYSLVIKFGITTIEPRQKNEVIEKYVNQAISARKTIKGKVGTDIAFYDEQMKKDYLREELIEQRMNQALEDKEFIVYYQPKYDLQTEEITGAEALVRWKKPDGSLVPPNHFIPLFEKNGFILHLDFYVFETVIRNIAEWTLAGKKIVPISVNVSRLHVGTPDFLTRMLELTETYHVSTSLIELELTETVMSEDADNIMEFLEECRDAGFKLSIDDFGSGYSSLNLLKSLPFDVLKIDKEFLNETGDSERSSVIIEQVIQMARGIHIDTICEGVETREQADFLKKIGCHMAQGFLFSRPLPREDFDKLL